MDFPVSNAIKPTLGTTSVFGVGIGLRAAGMGVSPANAAYPSANLGYYVPLALPVPALVKAVWWANGGTAAGNVDCGIYTAGGTLLASAAPTAMAGTNVLQSVTLGSPLLLAPGGYYLAMSCSSATANFRMMAVTAANCIPLGVAQQASVGTLPATATFATFAQTVLPIFGITRAAVI